MALWLDKHRPKKLSKLDFHKKQAEHLEKLVKSGDFPHLLVTRIFFIYLQVHDKIIFLMICFRCMDLQVLAKKPESWLSFVKCMEMA